MFIRHIKPDLHKQVTRDSLDEYEIVLHNLPIDGEIYSVADYAHNYDNTLHERLLVNDVLANTHPIHWLGECYKYRT